MPDDTTTEPQVTAEPKENATLAKILKIVDRYQFNGQAESRAIAELIGDSIMQVEEYSVLPHALGVVNQFIDAATSMREELRKLTATDTEKARAFDQIADLLFPEECPNREWNGETVELVAERVLKVYPKAAEGDRTFNPDSVKV